MNIKFAVTRVLLGGRLGDWLGITAFASIRWLSSTRWAKAKLSGALIAAVVYKLGSGMDHDVVYRTEVDFIVLFWLTGVGVFWAVFRGDR